MKRFLESLTSRDVLMLMLLIGIVQVACYYLAGMLVRGDGALAIAQPDTLLYAQAARRICEGAPFSFSAGVAASTGTTSVLYPFVLAVPYALGFTGDRLFTAGFVLNAFFYLAFLLAWGQVLLKFFPEGGIARLTAALMISLFGPFAYCALAQSDIGIWMALSAFIAWGLFSGRRSVYVPLLLLGPWMRPEGMMLIAAYGAFAGLRLVYFLAFGDRTRSPGVSGLLAECLFAALGVVSCLGVFALNYALTGEAQFMSLANKGYFTLYPFFQALYATAMDGMEVIKAYLLGLTKSAPRDFMFVPVLGALLLWLGVHVRAGKGFSWRQGVWIVAVLGSFWTVSTSGWQDKNLDRYLAWAWPLAVLFIAEGCEFLAEKGRGHGWGLLPAAVMVLFAAVMAVVFVSIFNFSSDGADRVRAFADRCEGEMAGGRSIGLWSSSGVAYRFSPRRVAHLCGVYSPEFRSRTPIAALEILKNEPETRFDYYFYSCAEDPLIWGGADKTVLKEQQLVGPDGYELRRADWGALDAAVAAPPAPKPGLQLVDRVDIAYEKDEKLHGYELLTMYHAPLFEPFTVSDKLNGANAVDGGRLVFGGDEMTVAARAGRDLHVVMRTCSRRKVSYARNLGSSAFDFAFRSPMELRLEVNGADAGQVSFGIATNGFSDVSFVIPAKAISSDFPRLGFHGDHISCGYWFYQ